MADKKLSATKEAKAGKRTYFIISKNQKYYPLKIRIRNDISYMKVKAKLSGKWKVGWIPFSTKEILVSCLDG